MNYEITKVGNDFDIKIMNFNPIRVSELKMKYNSSAEIPTHMLQLINQNSGEVAHLALRADIRPDPRTHDANQVGSVVNRALGVAIDEIMAATPWRRGQLIARHRSEQIVETHRFGIQETKDGHITYRTQGEKAPYVAVNLSNSIYFETALEEPIGRGRWVAAVEMLGTCEIFGKKTSFTITTPVVPLQWLNMDNIIQEIKSRLFDEFNMDNGPNVVNDVLTNVVIGEYPVSSGAYPIAMLALPKEEATQ